MIPTSRRPLRVALLLGLAMALVLPLATAANAHEEAAAKSAAAGGSSAEAMQAMMAGMMKCAVCSKWGPYMQDLGPVMKGEAIRMSDGMALIHTITDPAKVAVFRSAFAEIHEAGEACMGMTDEEAGTKLCHFCQGMRGAMKAGAHMSVGETKSGNIMVLTSSDPAVKSKLDELYSQCEMMNNM